VVWHLPVAPFNGLFRLPNICILRQGPAQKSPILLMDSSSFQTIPPVSSILFMELNKITISKSVFLVPIKKVPHQDSQENQSINQQTNALTFE
jgi:hypothetical protein